MVRRNATAALFAAALFATAGIASAAEPATTEPTAKELLEQIRQLQAKVEQLEVKQDEAASSAEVQKTVEQIVADAEKRSALFMQDDVQILAGHEKGKFYLKSADDNFSFSPSVQLQFRYVLNDTQNAEPDADDIGEHGFEVRRAKFAFGGNAFTPKLTYNFQWEANQQGGDVTLEEAWLRYQLSKQWYLGGGQFKDPIFQEERTSSKRQLAVDRSLLNELLAGGETDYVQGVYGLYDGGDGGSPLRAMFGYTDGANSINTNWRSTPTNDTDWGAFARVDFFVNGTRKQYDDFTALGNKEGLLVVGAGGDWTQSGNTDVFFHSADVQWENAQGLSAYGAIIGQWVDDDGGEDYNWGALAQVGYLFKPKWEVFGRYDVTFFDDDQTFATGNAQDMFQEFTIGVNHYLQGHAAKVTLDASYLPDGSPDNETGIGILAGDGDQFVFRAQFQLLL